MFLEIAGCVLDFSSQINKIIQECAIWSRKTAPKSFFLRSRIHKVEWSSSPPFFSWPDGWNGKTREEEQLLENLNFPTESRHGEHLTLREASSAGKLKIQ